MSYRIKRYANRKLYDVQRRRYVTLADLEEMIRAGREITVQDARTGDDLTAVTLAQVIVEIEREGRAALPAAFLHGLIKHGEAWGEFIRQSLRASLEGLIESRRDADRVFRAWAVRSGLVPAEERTAETPPRRGAAARRRGRKGRQAEGETPQRLSEEGGVKRKRRR